MQWHFGPFRLDLANTYLWRAEQPVPLRPKTFDLLVYLVTHAGQLVTKEALLDAVWPETAVGDGVLKTSIGELRRALGETGKAPQWIATVHGRGYRFVAPVTVVPHPDAAPAVTLPPAACTGHPLAVPTPPLAVPQPATAHAAAEGTRVPELERAPLAYTPTALAEKIRTARPALEGERKQATVLFADLKDSLELIRDLDPEAAQQLLDPALHAMMDAVHRYEGTVNQVLGDGIMALFGAPIAHEDHAVRACYAALTMQTALRAYAEDVYRTHGRTLQSRIGLNSGDVVVRTIHNDLHMDYSAVGQTTHLAARMEQAALPGTILFTDAIRRLVEGLMRVKAMGPMPIKGLAAPVEVFELLGAIGLQRRLQAAAARGLTRFVGRQTELAALNAALTQAGAAHGQVVAVVGEAGVGKSRLLYEFVQTAHTQGWLVLDSAAVSYGQATPYFPVVNLLRRYYHLEERDDIRTVRAKVTAQVQTLDTTLEETIPALLALLDALPADSPFWQLDAPQRRQRTLLALKRVLLRESQAQPVLLVCEDLHWLDTETQALLESLIESLPTARLLLLVNYRPGYRHGWGSKTYYTQLRLDPLPAASADTFLQALLGDNPSLASLNPLLIQRTEGNPFFLEESVRTLVETGVLVGEPGAYRMAQALPTIQVPATVQAVLAARIDRLPSEEKHLLQTAAVIGTEIPFSLLQAVGELPEEALRLGLAHLQNAEFLYEASLFPELAYTFKHVLTQEVAYGSLLHAQQRGLHARIVVALEALAVDRVVEQVERLAYHALRGEVWDKALVYSRQAGEKAMARSAHHEAVGYFEQALSALPHLPGQRDMREQAIDLRLALRSALLSSGDLGRILACLREAETLAEALDDPRRLGQVSVFLSTHFRRIGAYDQAIAAAQRALALATASGDSVLHALANQYIGLAYAAQGDYRRAIDCLKQTVASLDGAQRRERFGQLFLPAVLSRADLALCHAGLGTFAEGRAFGEEGLQIAEAVAHPSSLMLAYRGIGLLALRHGDLPRALPVLEQALGLCEDADLPAYFPLIAAVLGAAYTLDGRIAEAVPLLTQALEQATATEIVSLQALCRLSLSEAQLLAGRLEEAHVLAEGALAHARTHQERGHQAYALRLLGDIAARRDSPEVEQAEAHYREALALAGELGMRPLQAHCHLSLGTLYIRMGQREHAHTALSTAIALYRDMGMTFWLPQAKAALAQVDGR
jgi:class 3 adenylate cyclase/DNA-binding winged helix-turn-helix (wHTH) protein/tetratricopeptide (TPR) repeat protein